MELLVWEVDVEAGLFVMGGVVRLLVHSVVRSVHSVSSSSWYFMIFWDVIRE